MRIEGQLLARGLVEKSQIERHVREMLDVVWLGEFEARRPHQLYGGQPQRVVLARALVNDPKALLLDKLSALDREQRRQMQLELKYLQRDIGITFVLVTHDREEALTHGRPFAAGAPALLMVRPERLELAATEPPPERIGLPVTWSDVVSPGSAAALRLARRGWGRFRGLLGGVAP